MWEKGKRALSEASLQIRDTEVLSKCSASLKFPKPLSVYASLFINDTHTPWRAGSFQSATKNTSWKIGSGWFFFFFNSSKIWAQIFVISTWSNVSFLATGPKAWLLQGLGLLFSKVAGIFSQQRKLCCPVQHDSKQSHCNGLLFLISPNPVLETTAAGVWGRKRGK